MKDTQDDTGTVMRLVNQHGGAFILTPPDLARLFGKTEEEVRAEIAEQTFSVPTSIDYKGRVVATVMNVAAVLDNKPIKVKRRRPNSGQAKAHVTGLVPLDTLRAMKRSISKQQGIYFLWKGDELVYVGKSNNVHARIHGHGDKDWDSYSFVAMVDLSEYELSLVEDAYIISYEPKYNKWVSEGYRVRRIAEINQLQTL